MVKIELSKEVTLNPDWKDKEKTTYAQNEERTNILGNSISKSSEQE